MSVTLTREASAIMKRLNNRKGQALVEFALVVTLLPLLALGIWEFSKAWYYENALDVGVRAGVRYASELYPIPATDDSRIKTYVQNEINSYVPSMGSGSVAVTVIPPSVANGHLVTVTASYTFSETILTTLDSLSNTFFKEHISTSFTLERTGTMYYELGTT
jgi:Flp pilus assembly protein TadG